MLLLELALAMSYNPYASLLQNIVDGIFNSINNLQGRDQSTIENADEDKV
jgi:hypothetical protein